MARPTTREVSVESIGARILTADGITNPTARSKELDTARAEAALLMANAMEGVQGILSAYFERMAPVVEAWASMAENVRDFSVDQPEGGDNPVQYAAELLGVDPVAMADFIDSQNDSTPTEYAAKILHVDLADLANALEWVDRINGERAEREAADRLRAAIYDGDGLELRHGIVGAPDPHNDPDPHAPNDPAGIVEGQSFDDGADTISDDDFEVVVPDAPFDPTIDDQELQALDDGDASIATADHAGDIDADFSPSTANPTGDVFKEAKALKKAKASQPRTPRVKP